MHRTANETTEQTLARPVRALDHQHPVTIIYTRADGAETLRTIEIYDITITKAGDVLLKAMDRTSGESRSWRLDRVTAYTVHRTTYTVPRTTNDTPTGHGLAVTTPRVAEPTPATITTTRRLDVLTDLLAA